MRDSRPSQLRNWHITAFTVMGIARPVHERFESDQIDHYLYPTTGSDFASLSPTLQLPTLVTTTTTPSNATESSSCHSSSAPSPLPAPRRKRKTVKYPSRDRIEKKYRDKLTDSFDRLRTSVPSLLSEDEEEPEELKLIGLGSTTKKSKATTIAKATEFIEHMKRELVLVHARMSKAQMEMCDLKMENERLRGVLKSNDCRCLQAFHKACESG